MENFNRNTTNYSSKNSYTWSKSSSAKPKRDYKKLFQSIYNMRDLTVEQLEQRLKRTLAMIFVTVLAFGISILFLGPQIGSLFGFLSKYKGDGGNSLTTPINAPFLKSSKAYTNQSVTTISGISTPGYTIKLFVNGPEQNQTTVDGDGNFEFANINLNQGRNTIYAKAISDTNAESEQSGNVFITYDNKKPEIKVEKPKPAEIVKNLDKRIEITGRLNEKATVKINERYAIVKPDLSFELLLGVEEGKVELKIEATDEAGNKAEEKLEVKYEKKSF